MNADEVGITVGSLRKLAHVYWLGGSSCSGKTTLARLLAERHGLQTYHCDDYFQEHAARVDPVRHPYFAHIKDLQPEQLLMRPVDVQVEELYRFYDEEFEMVVEDLLAMPDSTPVVVEGAGLRPTRVLEHVPHPRQALWLTVSAGFRRRVYQERRGKLMRDMLSKCADPQKALANWQSRDQQRARSLTEELAALALPELRVDGGRTVEDNITEVSRRFGLGDRIEAGRAG